MRTDLIEYFENVASGKQTDFARNIAAEALSAIKELQAEIKIRAECQATANSAYDQLQLDHVNLTIHLKKINPTDTQQGDNHE